MNVPETFLFPPYKDEFKSEIAEFIREKTKEYSVQIYLQDLWDASIAYAIAMCIKFYDLFEESGRTSFSGMFKKLHGWTLPGIPGITTYSTPYSAKEFVDRQFDHIIDETCAAFRELFHEFNDTCAEICSNSTRTYLEDIEVARGIATDYFIDGKPIVSDIRFTSESYRDRYAKDMSTHLDIVFPQSSKQIEYVRQETILYSCKLCLTNSEKLYPALQENGEASQYDSIQESIVGDCCEAAMEILPSFSDDEACKCKEAVETLLKDEENAGRIVADYFDRGVSFLNPDFSCAPCKDECWAGMKPTMLKVQRITRMYLGVPQLHEIVTAYVCEQMLDLYDRICISCLELSPAIKSQIQDKSDHLVTEAGSAVMDQFPYFGEGSILHCKKQVDTLLADPRKARFILKQFKRQLG